MDFDLENPFIRDDEDSILDLFASESDHMSPFHGDTNLPSRQSAVSLIIQFARNFDPFLIYLAVNYLDRYLAKRETSISKPWILRLLAIACVSLAAKMKKLEFHLADLQRDDGDGEAFIFSRRTISRMEIHVLTALEWRMRSITPFCFLDYFSNFFLPAQLPYIYALKNRSVQLLLKAQNKNENVKFKPSVLAASALLLAAEELFPIQHLEFKMAISNSQFMDDQKLSNSIELMNDVAEMDSYELISSCETPVTVLELDYEGPKLKKRKTDNIVFE